MGVRIASLLTTASTQQAALLSITPSGITFRTALANLTEQANADGGSMESGAKSDIGADVPSGIASQQLKGQPSSSINDASSYTTADPQHDPVVASGASWSETRNSTGAQIASTSASASLAPSTPVPISPADNTSQAVQVNSSNRTYDERDSKIDGSQAHSHVGADKYIASQQKTVHSSSVVSDVIALITAPVPATDQPETSAAGRSSGPDKVNRSSNDAYTAAKTMQSQLPLSQSAAEPEVQSAIKADSLEQTTTRLKQINSTVPPDGDVAPLVQASRPSISSQIPQAKAGIATQIAGENLTVPIAMPNATALPGNADSNQSPVKAATKKISDIVASKNADLDSAMEAGKSKTAGALGSVSDGTSRGTQSSGPPTQHSQMGTAQAAAEPAKGIESGTNQAQASAIHLVSHEAATTLRSGVGVADGSSHGLPQSNLSSNELESDNAVTTSGINAAKLIQTMGQTGMSVGMRSSEFGNITIRTSVSQQQMLAQISLDHGGLSQALSSHVSSMQTKLENDYGLHTLIEVNSQGGHSTGDSGNFSQREQQEFVRSGQSVTTAITAEPEPGLGQGAMVSVSDGIRLDIRA